MPLRSFCTIVNRHRLGGSFRLTVIMAKGTDVCPFKQFFELQFALYFSKANSCRLGEPISRQTSAVSSTSSGGRLSFEHYPLTEYARPTLTRDSSRTSQHSMFKDSSGASKQVCQSVKGNILELIENVEDSFVSVF